MLQTYPLCNGLFAFSCSKQRLRLSESKVPYRRRTGRVAFFWDSKFVRGFDHPILSGPLAYHL